MFIYWIEQNKQVGFFNFEVCGLSWESACEIEIFLINRPPPQCLP